MFKKLLNNTQKEIVAFYKDTKKPFLIITIILLISFLALFRSNFLYIDDMGRTMDGYTGWGGFSRYTSVILAILIHTGFNLADASPLPQLLAIFFLALACCLLLYIFKVKLYRQKINFFDIAAVCILALCPYFLECMSYKFDAPFMALSILACILPFFFFFYSRRLYFISIFFCTILMCTTYQASSGIFPILVLFVSFARLYQKESWKPVLKDLALSALIYIASLAFFSLVLMRPIPADSYVSNSLQSFPAIIPGVFTRLGAYYRTMFADFRLLWIILIGFLVCLFPVAAAVRSRKASITLAALGCILLSACFAFGLYPALQLSPIFPRAMYGIGAPIALMALQISCLSSHISLRLPGCILAYCFIIFTCIYGNALTQQREWAEFRAEMLASDLKNLPAFLTNETKSIKIGGSIHHAASIVNYSEHTDSLILEKLVPIALEERMTWGIFYLAYFGLGPIEYKVDFEPQELVNYTEVVNNHYHSIYAAGNDIVVVFK